MKTTIRLFTRLLLLLCLLAAWPKAQAVVPPPDGGYPNFTTAEGQKALFSLTSGAANTAVGWSALLTNAAGSFNTATGAGALLFNIADDNTALGAATLLFNITGMDNTAVGAAALSNNTMGQDNTATGAFALLLNTTGNFNTANGFDALFSNTEGQFNTAYGSGALDLNSVGDSNTAIGTAAMQANTTGSNNTAIGNLALEQNTTGARNIALGVDAGIDVTSASDVICIGAPGANVDNSCYIGQIFNATSANGIPVLINSSNKLGTTTSSRRFKENIKPMDQVSEALFALQPVTFHYKKEIDPESNAQFGLVAEDVEKVNSALVVRDKEGKPYSVRYDQVNAMLLNEFLKAHQKAQRQEATITQLKSTVTKDETAIAQQRNDFEATIRELKKEMETVAERFKEQDAKIQKVSDQVELSKRTPQTVLNSQ